MDEATLKEKLRLIEALFAGATIEGEKVAAERARDRILERLKRLEQKDPPVEYRFSMADMWSRKVLVALLRRYGFRPYRYSGQRYTTVMARVSKPFVDETLWPAFQEFSETLRIYLAEVTDRVVSQVIHQDSSEAEVVVEPKQLPRAVGEVEPANTGGPASRSKTGPTTGPQASPGSGHRSGHERKRRKKRNRR